MRRFNIRDGKWHRVHSHMGCCDCGLVHRIKYRGIIIRGRHFLDAQVFRDKKLTKEARKSESYPFVPRLAKTPAELAKKFHEVYERLAPRFSHRTRKALMIAICKELLNGME